MCTAIAPCLQTSMKTLGPSKALITASFSRMRRIKGTIRLFPRQTRDTRGPTNQANFCGLLNPRCLTLGPGGCQGTANGLRKPLFHGRMPRYRFHDQVNEGAHH